MEHDAQTTETWEQADFRRPNRLTRDQVRSLDVLHDTFTRRFSAALSSAVRAPVGAEIVRATQLTWEDFVRTLPSHTLLATLSVDPLPGGVLVEMDTSVALALVDRLLGGPGTLGTTRRPTDLEAPPLRRIAQMGAEAFGDAITQFVDVDAELTSVDYSPQLVALASPGTMVLVLTYSLNVPSAGISGDLMLCIPLTTLAPALDKLAAHAAERTNLDDHGRMAPIVSDLPVTVEARLAATPVPAIDIARLSAGDVIVLEHRMGAPAYATVNGKVVFTGHIGKRGRRFALSVADHPFVDPPAPVDEPEDQPATVVALDGTVLDERLASVLQGPASPADSHLDQMVLPAELPAGPGAGNDLPGGQMTDGHPATGTFPTDPAPAGADPLG